MNGIPSPIRHGPRVRVPAPPPPRTHDQLVAAVLGRMRSGVWRLGRSAADYAAELGRPLEEMRPAESEARARLGVVGDDHNPVRVEAQACWCLLAAELGRQRVRFPRLEAAGDGEPIAECRRAIRRVLGDFGGTLAALDVDQGERGELLACGVALLGRAMAAIEGGAELPAISVAALMDLAACLYRLASEER